jgi:hypothetical protein
MRVPMSMRNVVGGVHDKEGVRSSAGVAANTRRDEALSVAGISPERFRTLRLLRCGNGSECRCRLSADGRANNPRPFDHDEDVDDQAFLVGRYRIGHILLDEHVLRFKPLVSEKVGNRLIGIVQSAVRAAMHKFERMALRRCADGDVVARRAFRRLGERKSGFELNAFVIRRGKVKTVIGRP